MDADATTRKIATVLIATIGIILFRLGWMIGQTM